MLLNEILHSLNTREEWTYYGPVFQNFLQRNYYSLKAVEALLVPYESDANYKFPIGLQIRTCLLDCITLAYIGMFAYSNDQDGFNKAMGRINLRFAKKMKDEIENEEELFNLSMRFPQNFISQNGKVELKGGVKEIQPADMANELKQSHPNSYINYEQYSYYSKYEHYGYISKIMLDSDPRFELEKLLLSLCLIFNNIHINLIFLETEKQQIDLFLISHRKIEYLFKNFVEGNPESASM